MRKSNKLRTIWRVWWLALAIMFTLLFGGSFILGIKYNSPENNLANILNKETNQPEQVDFDAFWQAWKT